MITQIGRKGKDKMHDSGTMRLFTRMSKVKRRRFIVKLIEDAIFLYVMGAGIWTICYLVSEIFQKIGVA